MTRRVVITGGSCVSSLGSDDESIFKSLRALKNKIVRMVGYYVCRKWVRTIKGDIMNFCTWTDSKGIFFDTVHFPQNLAKYPLKGRGCYILKGKIVEDFGFPSLEVIQLEKLPYVQDNRY